MGAVFTGRDVAVGVAIDREVDGDDVVVEQVERPDVEGGSRQIDAAGCFGGDLHSS
jgi:hypothetical protein